jgi:hypothetical protein
MDKVLPIIIGLIWIGYKLYQKNLEATQKANQPTENPPISVESFIDNAFENLKNQFSEPTLQTEFVDKSNYQNYKEEESAQNTKTDYFNYEESLLTKERKTTIAPIEIDKEVSRNELQKIDLRKAMIYHAIFDRPYN